MKNSDKKATEEAEWSTIEIILKTRLKYSFIYIIFCVTVPLFFLWLRS